MSTRTDRLPASRANLVLGAVFVAGVVATLALGLWAQAIMLGAMLLLGVFGIYRARRPGAGDVTRVDALEYRDERDRVIARDGFAVVGALALVLSLVEFVLVSVLLPDWILVPFGQTAVLCVGWGLANRAAARRH
jgi:hypothetical protein